MDRKAKPVSADKLLEKFFRDMGEDQRFRELGVFEVWDELMGEEIRKNAQPVSVNKGRLIVSVRNSMWLNELGFSRPKIKSKLNRELGKGTITDITFRIGSIPEKKAEEAEVKQSRKAPDPKSIEQIKRMVSSIEDERLRELLKNWLAAVAER